MILNDSPGRSAMFTGSPMPGASGRALRWQELEVVVRCADGDVADAVARDLAEYRCLRAPSESGPPQAKLEVCLLPGLDLGASVLSQPADGAGWTRVPVLAGSRTAWRADIGGERYVVLDDSSTVIVRDSSRTRVAVASRNRESLVRDAFAIIRGQAVFSWAARRWTLVHAAAVELESGAILIIGDSGAGKTSAQLALMSKLGAMFLSNDRVAVRAQPAGVEAVGLPYPLTASPGSLRGYPSLLRARRDGVPFDTRGKLCMGPSQIAKYLGVGTSAKAYVTAIIHPSINATADAIRVNYVRPCVAERRISRNMAAFRQEMCAADWLDCLDPGPHLGSDNALVAAALACRPSYQLDFGHRHHPDEIASVLEYALS
jgi:hypothetical protein